LHFLCVRHDHFVSQLSEQPAYPGGTLRANIGETSLVPLINEQGEKEKGRDERKFSWC
jgi:hypothetical protein